MIIDFLMKVDDTNYFQLKNVEIISVYVYEVNDVYSIG